MDKTLILPIKYPVTLKAAVKMIFKYINDFKQFGEIEIINKKPIKGSKGGRPKRIVYLNESQINLLFMYLGNTSGNRKYKINLVVKLKRLQDEMHVRK